MAINKANHGRRKGTPIPYHQPPSEAQKTIFLEQYEETLSIVDARKASTIGRAALDTLLQKDPAFLKAMREITEDNLQRVEDAAFRGAISKNDKDLIRMILVAHKPELYGPRATINLNVDVTKLTTEELQDLIEKHSKR